jgi:hypothetical protein
MDKHSRQEILSYNRGTKSFCADLQSLFTTENHFRIVPQITQIARDLDISWTALSADPTDPKYGTTARLSGIWLNGSTFERSLQS